MTEQKSSHVTPLAPRATYRLQLQARFSLRHALELVPYLSALGVSHLYVSPLLRAQSGSTHCYDVCDCSQLNPELGAEADLESLASALRERGMGLVLDIVPNHMGIGPENPWWWDVLTHGPASRYANHFDIDWNPPDAGLKGKVLVPVLGDEYERVLERGELKLELAQGIPVLCYFEHRFPIAPGSLVFLDEPFEAALKELNANRAAMDTLLQRQHYRLVFWRHGDSQLNYRRFFNVSTLAAARVEDPQVFRNTHHRILDWLQRGLFDGLRIDHPDGLRNPQQYLQRLRAAAPLAWIVVEKILEPGEELPADWPVAGTTGYDFLNRVTALFVDPAGEKPLTEFYAEFTGESVDDAAIARKKKRRVLHKLLAAEVNALTRLLEQLAQRHKLACTREQLRQALIEVFIGFPVYRTYAQPDLADSSPAVPISPDDLRHIEQALMAARQAETGLGAALFEFIGDLLRLRRRGGAESEFVIRFQQLAGPAMAKGVEDTAFYCFNRFIALNEVGGDPGQFEPGFPSGQISGGMGNVAEFHRHCARVQRAWPQTMLTTSTHDTKRSEDVRARLCVLSEIPEEWSGAVRRWSALNERHRRNGLPDRNAEYLFYQTLAGAWPLPADRAFAYMEKASREAKQHTSWTEPNPAYDAALKQFVMAAFDDPEFTSEVQRFVESLIEPGRINSLAQTLLKLTAPGVPDIYQGTELWDLSLVDPDNRRPVDFEIRRRLLEALANLSAEQVWQRRDEGLPKLWLIQKTLAVRRRRPEPFGAGSSYEALAANGTKAAHVVAFIRGSEVIATAPRLVVGLAGDWANTTVELPEGEWRNQLTGEPVGGGTCRLADLLRRFPVALLARKEAN
ncbi:MAG: malto-oligosyltrehalose synthase [Verrucomicrobia bacterium]|nr:malto-oligosyltrehalose synthase [Verrucomicrobiota bacterium]